MGCAVASALVRRGRSVVVLEAAAGLGQGVSSRNSGVIHSGLYYEPGSLKAQWCVEGQARLYAWCGMRNVWHQACGKLVVATSDSQEAALDALYRRARENGAPDVERVGGRAARELEPSLGRVTAALWCPQTGLVDAVAFTHSLAADAQEEGALILTHAKVDALEAGPQGWRLETARGAVVAPHVVNAAGLHADHVAALAGVNRYRIHPCRGDYFRWKSPVRWTRLIYPVKDPLSPGLGVHLTLDRDGGVRLGPDTTWVTDKEDVSGGSDKRAAFQAAAKALFGDIPDEALTHDGCGIRPKLRSPEETEERDFVVAEDLPGLINLVGMESPGLTAALAVASHVAGMVCG